MTVAACHFPPVALLIPRRFNSVAAASDDKSASSRMTGRIRSTFAAASCALRSLPPVHPPSFTPRRFAAAICERGPVVGTEHRAFRGYSAHEAP